jgi:hypothetical protein
MNYKGDWRASFLEADCKTSLPRQLNILSSDSRAMHPRCGSQLLEDKQSLKHGIEIGRGGTWLGLTDESTQSSDVDAGDDDNDVHNHHHRHRRENAAAVGDDHDGRDLGEVSKLFDIHQAIGKHGPDLKLSTHCLDEIAQSREIHVGAVFHLGHGTLIHFQGLSKLCLGKAARFAQFVEGQRFEDFLRRGLVAFSAFRGHLRS